MSMINFGPGDKNGMETLVTVIMSTIKLGLICSFADKVFEFFFLLIRKKTKPSKGPKMIQELSKYRIKQVSCGARFVVCLTFNGNVFTCGEKDFFGQGELESDLSLPKKLLKIGKIGFISCGWQHTVLISHDGNTLWSFGSNSFGQLGHTENTLEPNVIESMSDKQIIKHRIRPKP